MGLAHSVGGSDGLFGPDYTNDRIGGLEREVEQLKDELRRTRMSAGAADGGFEPSAPSRGT